MAFFFVRDYKHRYRYISTEAVSHVQIRTPRWKKIWEAAKKKLMLLPQRVLRQEQAFRKVLQSEEKKIQIVHSEHVDKRKIKTKFFFFLQKQRTRHILLLVGEALLLPFGALAGLLPGPNVFFGVLVLLMITHWQALRGINRTLKKEFEFISSSLLREWEEALNNQKEEDILRILKRIEREYDLHDVQKILWK